MPVAAFSASIRPQLPSDVRDHSRDVHIDRLPPQCRGVKGALRPSCSDHLGGGAPLVIEVVLVAGDARPGPLGVNASDRCSGSHTMPASRRTSRREKSPSSWSAR